MPYPFGSPVHAQSLRPLAKILHEIRETRTALRTCHMRMLALYTHSVCHQRRNVSFPALAVNQSHVLCSAIRGISNDACKHLEGVNDLRVVWGRVQVGAM
jgi:hypothetical protein